MKKAICTTTINAPTVALKKFAEIAERDDWMLFIAGDKRTPAEEYLSIAGDHQKHVCYLTPEFQERKWPELSRLIGWNCIQRRNFAFLAAYQWGAELFATVDDDNVPMEHWGHGTLIGDSLTHSVLQEVLPVFDPIVHTNYPHLWHRGYPLELVHPRRLVPSVAEKFVADVQADFWNGDPDIDSICRMLVKPSCLFKVDYFPITANKPSPFNSQNTFLTRRVIPHYFMFPGVGRYDDIMGSYHVQAQGFRVVYGAPSVVQERNEHDLMKDFAAEVWGQQNCLAIASKVSTDKRAVLDAIPERSRLAFEQYQRHFE